MANALSQLNNHHHGNPNGEGANQEIGAPGNCARREALQAPRQASATKSGSRQCEEGFFVRRGGLRMTTDGRVKDPTIRKQRVSNRREPRAKERRAPASRPVGDPPSRMRYPDRRALQRRRGTRRAPGGALWVAASAATYNRGRSAFSWAAPPAARIPFFLCLVFSLLPLPLCLFVS